MNDPADQAHLEEIALFFGRLYLEVERGLRDPESLRPFMTAPGWRFSELRDARRALPGGAVMDGDVKGAQVRVHPRGRADAVVMVRTGADRWSALTVELRTLKGRWALHHLHRLRTGRHYRVSRRESPRDEAPLDHRISVASTDRRFAARALEAAERRLRQSSSTNPGRTEAGLTANTWRRIVDHLDRELEELRHRRDAARAAEDPPRRR